MSTTSAFLANPLGITNQAFYVIGIMHFPNWVNVYARCVAFSPSVFTFVAKIFCHFNPTYTHNRCTTLVFPNRYLRYENHTSGMGSPHWTSWRSRPCASWRHLWFSNRSSCAQICDRTLGRLLTFLIFLFINIWYFSYFQIFKNPISFFPRNLSHFCTSFAFNHRNHFWPLCFR